MATTGWLGEQTVFTIQEGTYSTWIASDVYISSNTRSGDNVTVSGTIKLYIRCNWETSGLVAYYGDPITVTPRGGSAIEIKGWTSTTSLDFYKDQEIGSVDFTTTYSEPASSTSSTFSVYYKDTSRDDWVNDTLLWTTSIDPGYSAPTGLTVSIVEKYTGGAKFNVSISSYGNPSSVSGRWIEAGIAGQNAWESPSLRSAIVENSTSAQITVNNSSTQSTTLIVQPNTQYYYGAFATNTQLNTNTVQGQFVTLAPSPTVTVGSVSGHSATINYSTVADGGYYDKTIEYSTDGGATWQTGATVTGGSAQTGSFTIDNLPSGENTVLVRTNTSSGADSPVSITVEIEKMVKFYGPVPTSVLDLGEMTIEESTYPAIISVDKQTVIAMMNSETSIINQIMEGGKITSLVYQVVKRENDNWRGSVRVVFRNGQIAVYNSDDGTAEQALEFLDAWGGVGIEPTSSNESTEVTLTGVTYNTVSKEVKKLYGSIKNYVGADGITHEPALTGQPESIVDVDQTAFLNFLENSNLFKKDVEKYGEVQQLICSAATVSGNHIVQVAGGFGQGSTGSWYFNKSNTDWAVVADQLLSATGITLETSVNLSASRIFLVNPEYSSVSKKITKLYGSLNGGTKLVFQDES